MRSIIQNDSLKTNNYISYTALILFLTAIIMTVSQSVNGAVHRFTNRFNISFADSLKTDSLSLGDSVSFLNDTVSSDSLPKEKKQAIDAPVIYEASDSIVYTRSGFAYLYGKAKVNYQDIQLEAAVIKMNIDSSTVFAEGVKDSLGTIEGKPVFTDGAEPYESETMNYNFKSKKGFITNVTTQQGEGYLTSQNTKKDANDDLFMESGRYTTCDNHEHPHFYLQLTKAKVRPKKNVVFGPAYMVVEDVPLPLAIPFGFFPFTDSYSSGIIMPSFGDELQKGYFLRDGGYYFAISDKMDMKITGDIYTKGSWALGLNTNYIKRYKFSGNIDMHYQNTILGEKNMPDYSVSKDFRLNWSHRQDPKANPYSTFSASVNFSTSSYDRNNTESQYNSQLYSQNTKTSSISYSYTTPNQKLTISSSFNLSQNTRDSSIALTLPDLTISLRRIYPFKRKNASGKERWYEKISVGYTGQIRNTITTKEDKLFKSNLIRDWRNGVSHNIPISATFQLFKYLNVTPSFTYNERWYSSKIERNWDNTRREEVRDTVYGFNRVYNYNFSIGLNTKLYGFYKPIKAIFGDKIEAIRHVFTPNVSFSAAPDFGKERYGFYGTYSYIDEYGETITTTYNKYEHGLFGSAPTGKQGNLNFGVSNNFEMKVRSDRDSTGFRVISLIDDFTTGLSYNIPTKRWSDMNMSIRLKLPNNFTINLSSTFYTYAYEFDKNGNVVPGDRTEWSYGRFGRFGGISRSFSYTFDNNTWNKWFGKDKEEEAKKKAEQDKQKGIEALNSLDQNQNGKKKEDAKLDNDGYMKIKIPWSFTVSYSCSMSEDRSKPINTKNMRYPFKLIHNLSGNGNIKIANNWSLNMSTSYDFEAKKLAQTSLNIARDLHCWSMSASVQLGYFNSYFFTIRANSSLLQDLKWEKRNARNSNIVWY